jgi:hypothetical protein
VYCGPGPGFELANNALPVVGGHFWDGKVQRRLVHGKDVLILKVELPKESGQWSELQLKIQA